MFADRMYSIWKNKENWKIILNNGQFSQVLGYKFNLQKSMTL